MTLINLDIKNIAPPSWQKAGVIDLNISNHVHIWHIDIADNLRHINNFLPVLNGAELMRANKYFRQTDRDRFIISRGGLRMILSKYIDQSPAGINFDIEANKKPFIADEPQLHFNLSDTNGKILIAIAKSEVGIDVEYLKPDFSYDGIISNYFNNEEASYIKQQDSINRFFLLWTRKEAFLKATGIGLTDHLQLIPSLNGAYTVDGGLLSTQNNWQLNSFAPAGNYIATVAIAPGVDVCTFYDFILTGLILG